jgi:hypothetical protein
MKRAVAIVALASISMLSAGCNRNQTKTASEQPPSAPLAQPPAPSPGPPPPLPIPLSTQLAVTTVDSVMLSRDPDSPSTLIIQVTGTAPTSGWTDPLLTPQTAASDDMTVRTYRLVATSPAAPPSVRTPTTVAAELRLEDLPPEVKTIRITAGTNEISAPVAE